jgi:hypothetical protein
MQLWRKNKSGRLTKAIPVEDLLAHPKWGNQYKSISDLLYLYPHAVSDDRKFIYVRLTVLKRDFIQHCPKILQVFYK